MDLGLRWQDLIEIALWTVALSSLYLWLRGTVALHVAVVVLTLAAGGFAAGQLGLLLTSRALSGLSAIAVLVAVVVYRDEIRRALHRAYPLGRWRSRDAGGPPRHHLAPVVDAVADLADRRVGALVVLPQAEPVDDHVSGGTPLDGLLSAELLEAVFQPGSPVHDGAVVVDGERIARAGALLPLSLGAEPPEGLGTRHLAAIGLTERCDALVIAVSEQRGEISLIGAGRILGVFTTAGELEAALAQEIPASARPRRPRHATDQPGLRARLPYLLAPAAALALVIATWSFAVGHGQSLIFHAVAVEVRDADPALELAAPRPLEVTVQLRVPRSLAVEDADIAAWIDASGLEPGSHRVPVSTSARAGLEVVQVVPSHVEVTLRGQPPARQLTRTTRSRRTRRRGRCRFGSDR